MSRITPKAVIGFILLGLLTFWASGWKVRTSSKPLDIPYLVSPHPYEIQLALTAAVLIFAMVVYICLKKIEPWAMQKIHENAEAVRQQEAERLLAGDVEGDD